ncbi:hypothetical protein GWC95_10255 [Sediminibacterium roseum]|uniref:Signal transduction histidine kinase internal region domain-containing protein n=1 Tax=Sediminibacterium roseum TaxID=1978412 RepID=A0ABW9ZTI0_9BACT|nr:histidine kinase [Sediminibacterium roseum]NCI50304.1 hypothetical protein [Sediminibacterium roseum]
MSAVSQPFKFDKYAKIEIAFFAFVSFCVPLLSDLEYSFNEQPEQFSTSYYSVNVIRRLVWGSYHFFAYYLFYLLAIKRLLLKKKYFYFLLAFAGFVVFMEFFIKYGMYGTISKMNFLPAQLRTEAQKFSRSNGRLSFTISYLMLQVVQMTALGYFVHQDRQDKQLRELQRLQAEADLRHLKAQLQPHFFFNTLNNIYSLALQRSELTAPLVSKLSDMMRYVIYESDHQKVRLKNEVRFINNYIDVQSVRYSERISIRFDTQGIDDTAAIEPLLLLPFIENAFKHGTENETAEGFIDIVVCLTGQEFTLSVANSRVPQAVSTPAGIGLATTKKRLAILYPGKHSLTIDSTSSVYKILLTLMLD